MSEILVRGDPRLERPSGRARLDDPALPGEVAALHGALTEFRRINGYGRAIAAPQIGVPKRVIAMDLGAGPLTLVNPQTTWRSEQLVEVWDDCMSVPDQVVRVRRHRSISLECQDARGRELHWQRLPTDLAELLQHELDHLDGALMTARAVDAGSVRPIGEHAQLVAPARPRHRLSLEAIREAASTIDPAFARSPQYESEPLSEALGCRLTLKVETVNPIRSFKGRGADHLMTSVTAEGDTSPLVCASAGNFGQALAYACRRFGVSLVVYASERANPLKVARMRALGADVRLAGDDFDAAKAAARRYGEETGARLVEDGREPAISEGAGSIAVELLERDAVLDAVTVPLGNGALVNGMARWLKAASPWSQVIGVSSAGADAMARSWRSGRVVERAEVDTIADGIAVRAPVPEAVADMAGLVDDVALVTDDAIIEAMRLLHRHAGLVVEPAGAAGLAAIVDDPDRYRGRRVATVVCGSNLTDDDVARWLAPHASHPPPGAGRP